MGAASENWWLHQAGYTDSAHRIDPNCPGGGVGYLINQLNTAADSWFRTYAQNNYNAWDGLMMDDTSGGMSQQFYQGYYSNLLDDMAYVDNKYPSGYFLVLDSRDPSGSLQGCRVTEATVLLGYSPGQVVDHADLETNGNDLAVWPEEGIYPTDPVQSMSAPGGSGCEGGDGGLCSSGGHNSLEVASGGNYNDAGAGVYRRELRDCYNQGVSFGPCAAIVNDTWSTVTVQSSWLSQSYGHVITMNGGDVQSGGTINVTGASFTAGSTTIPAGDAVLLSQ